MGSTYCLVVFVCLCVEEEDAGMNPGTWLEREDFIHADHSVEEGTQLVSAALSELSRIKTSKKRRVVAMNMWRKLGTTINLQLREILRAERQHLHLTDAMNLREQFPGDAEPREGGCNLHVESHSTLTDSGQTVCGTPAISCRWCWKPRFSRNPQKLSRGVHCLTKTATFL